MSGSNRVLVVTGDPGGARVLIPSVVDLARAHPKWSVQVLAGPNSEALWRGAGLPMRFCDPSVSREVAGRMLASWGPDLLVCGTSFESPMESRFRVAARADGVPSFTVLDHWGNYKERYFLRRGGLALPDRLGVPDSFARRRCVEEGLPARILVTVGHPVLEQYSAVRAAPASELAQVVFLSEPISWDGELQAKVIRNQDHNELTVLRSLLEAFASDADLKKRPLLIRPHPIEPEDRLREVVDRHAPDGLDVRIDRSGAIEKVFAQSGAVIGMTSIALLQAWLMGYPVLSLEAEDANRQYPDDILRFLPRLRSEACFIEAVSAWLKRPGRPHRALRRGRKPRLPKGSIGRIRREMERLIDAKSR
ncbi:MAG: hypothetical protein JO317_05030 [Verrucomicrobiae bacterium]|nr:hypothetical protein [Verrucomicrobiae bacterium]